MKTATTLTLALTALLAVPALATGESAEIEVGRNAQLLLELHSGTLIVQTWDQDRVRVEAWGDDEIEIDLRERGTRVRASVFGIHGHPVDAEVEVMMPNWMAVEVEGRELDCELEQIGASVDVRVLGGDLLVQGGREHVRIRSVHGSVTLRQVSANVDVHATNGDIRMRDVEGEILAESVHGSIRIEGALAPAAELVSTSGDLLYDGSIDPGGEYWFSTHDGDVRLAIPPDTSALIEIETWQGDVEVAGPGFQEALREVRRDREYRLDLGQGEARVRIRNFSGDVELYDLKRGRGKKG